jgi:hypothetical protein
MDKKIEKTCNIPFLPESDFYGDSVVAKNKIWKTNVLHVCFLNGSEAQKTKIKNIIQKNLEPLISVKFKWGTTAQESEIRLKFGKGGSWSYVGTDCARIPKSQETMNLQWIDTGVVLHEFMHALGFEHEMGNPLGAAIQWNKEAVYKDLSAPPNNWPKERVDSNVFQKLDPATISATNFDKDSIMLYPISEKWTLDGFSSGINSKLSALDIQKLKETYPIVLRKFEPEIVPEIYKPEEHQIPNALSEKDILKKVFPNRISVQRLWLFTLVDLANALGGNYNKNSPKHEIYNFIFKQLEI